MKRILLIPMVSISLKGMLLGGIINVPGDHSTIQAALNAAQTGDTVLVQPGTYYENIFWPDVNGIKLISAGDSSNTIIDGGGTSSVIYMNPTTATIDTTTVIEGFKITNGGGVTFGGGFFVQNASPIILNMLIDQNTATDRGGGLYLRYSESIIKSSSITDNEAPFGGGIWNQNSSTLMSHLVISRNIGWSKGGGMFVSSGSVTLKNMKIMNNRAGSDGGGLWLSGNVSMTTLLIVENSGTNGGGIFFDVNRGTDLKFSDIQIIHNTGSNGGGLYAGYDYTPGWGSGTLTWSNVVISKNVSNYGGGIYSKGNPPLSNLSISHNEAVFNGGGIYFQNSQIPQSQFLTITHNRSRHGVGGLFSESGSSSISKSNLLNNGAGYTNSDNSVILDADSVWWGHTSGPYHPNQNPTGQGDSVNAFVNVTPWLTTPDTTAPPIPAQNLISTGSGNDFINLSWDPSPLGDFAGYILYYDSDSSGYPYSNSLDVGTGTSYSLTGLQVGTPVYLAVTVYDTDGNESWYSNEVTLNPAVLDIYESNQFPTKFALHQNYPNPFNPTTRLEFDLPHQVQVSLKVYDIMGREVITMVNESMNPGYHRLVWDGRNKRGQQVPTGIYIAKLVTPEYDKSIKMVLLK